MKVLHVYKAYFPDICGGVAQVISQLIKGSEALGLKSEVLCLSPNVVEKTIVVRGHKVHRCRSSFEIASSPFSFSAFLRFRQLSQDADLIHYHFPYPFGDILHLTTAMKKPTLVTYHSDIVKQKYLLKLYRPLQEFFLRSVDHIVATSSNYQSSSYVLERFKNKTSVIPIGIDKAFYPVTSTKKLNFWSKKFGLRFFLFVGVIRYYKGLHILIDAALNSDYPIVLVGSGPIEEELKEQAKKLGVKNIHFLGFLPDADKVALLELCYAFVFPSHLRSEAFGVSLLEAAMYGKPLISCEIDTGTSYINIDKKTGLVVPPSDSVALRHAMDYLWHNPKEAASMGEQAEKRYEKLFTAEKMASSYVDLYQTLVT